MSIQSNFPNTKPSLLLDFANTKQLDNRVTFTRSTPAVYYDGKTTAMAEQNLILQSQTFDNASWTKGNVTVTADSATTAPDGSTTADLFYPSSTGTWRIIYQARPKANIQYTITVYAKASGFSNFFVGFDNQTTTVAWFNLSTGVKGTKGSSITSSDMTSVGNGWYRCQVVFTHPSDSFALFGVSDADNSSTATASGTNGALIWGAQLEQRSTATAYTATTSQAITNYIPVLLTAASGVARFDNNPTTGESLGLLIEESRTNLQVQSQYASGWTAEGGALTANTVIAPDGTLTGALVVANATTSVHKGYPATVGGLTTATTYTATVFMKAAGYNYGFIRDGFTGNYVIFDLSAGTVSSSSSATGAITSVGNSWYRCSASMLTSGTNFRMDTGICSTNAQTPSTSWLGNGFSGIFIWGAQLEAGAFATSYIPTVASQVTRAADAASMTGTNFSTWYSINGGSLYGSYRIAFTSGTRYVLSIDQNIQNYVELAGNSTTNRALLFNRSGNTLDVNITGTSAVSLTSLNQVAIAVANNDFALYLNGTSQGTDTSATLAQTLVSLEIGRYNEGSPGGYLNGTIAKIAYYPIRVSNTNLQALTS